MSIFSALLQKTSSIRSIGILFIASHLVLLSMMVFTFPIINNQIGTRAFDLQTFGYSVSIAELIVNSLDSQATRLYLFPQLTFLDLLYPLLLALFLSSLLFRITNSGRKLGSVIVVVPFLAMVFDYSENLCIILMITKSVTISEPFVLMSSSFTILKGLLTSTAWIAVFILSIRRLTLRIKEKKNEQNFAKPKLH